MREEINAIVKTTIYGMIAASAGVVAFLFAVIAAFLWVQQHYDTIVACGVVGGMFLLVALVALISLAVTRSRAAKRKAREEAEAANATPSWLADPAMLLAAFQVARTIGFGKIIPLALAGIAAFGAANAFGGRDKKRAAEKRAARQKSTQEEQARRVA